MKAIRSHWPRFSKQAPYLDCCHNRGLGQTDENGAARPSTRFQLAIISKTENQNKHNEVNKGLMVKGGTLLGVLSIQLFNYEETAEVGLLIHHELNRQHYAKEALFAVLDYVLLGNSVPIHGGALGGLGLERVVMEGEVAEVQFKKLLQSLHIEHCSKSLKYHLDDAAPKTVLSLSKEEWEEARTAVTFEWMPKSHGGPTKEGIPSFGLLGDVPQHEPL